MKRTGFKKPSYEEYIRKQQIAQKKRAKRLKDNPVVKVKVKQKPKADRIKSLKTKLWVIFSQYIRKSYADVNGMVLTCDGHYKKWNEGVDCGHLFANTERNKQLGGNELWYYENNFAPQDNQGNRFNAKDSAKNYMLWAIRKYGMEEVEKMKKMKDTPKKWTEEELEEKYLYYKREFDKL